MSAGPIKRWRDGHKPPKTTPVSERLHAHAVDRPTRAYCGASDRPEFASTEARVTCSNCLAALRADKETS